ncbi:hypothetical protein RRG08_048742 [Elysia crispata]|uniref:Uncharacterized protein n=1 Tax=Elysia crispata TaxID=231223 RepID=A0AAE0YZE1_9GAST|nr:hypothetical protein RRG08_048742 [Elysia crispata]
MSTKDLQVVKSVVLVCSTFIMSQLPFVMLSATRIINPDNSSHQPRSMSTKDLQVVKSVVLVCSTFIMSQLPFVMLSATRLINPEYVH